MITTQDISTTMSQYAVLAASYAQDVFAAELDSTPASVAMVETCAARLYNDKPKNFISNLLFRGPSDAEVMEVAKIFGGYIGEVLRSKVGGSWEHRAEGGIGLHVGDTWYFPVGQVHRRLTEGPRYNLNEYFQIALDEQTSQKGVQS